MLWVESQKLQRTLQPSSWQHGVFLVGELAEGEETWTREATRQEKGENLASQTEAPVSHLQ